MGTRPAITTVIWQGQEYFVNMDDFAALDKQVVLLLRGALLKVLAAHPASKRIPTNEDR